jgi:hypothetical protein
VWRMRRRRSEDSLVGSTTRASSFPSSAATVWATAASSVAGAVPGVEGEAVEDDRTAVFGSLREERDLLVTNPNREVAAAAAGRGRSGKSARRWAWERSNGAESVAIWPGQRRGRGTCGGRSIF